jgi:hypothetical protein
MVLFGWNSAGPVGGSGMTTTSAVPHSHRSSVVLALAPVATTATVSAPPASAHASHERMATGPPVLAAAP